MVHPEWASLPRESGAAGNSSNLAYQNITFKEKEEGSTVS
jgi:hypothetical protein